MPIIAYMKDTEKSKKGSEYCPIPQPREKSLKSLDAPFWFSSIYTFTHTNIGL